MPLTNYLERIPYCEADIGLAGQQKFEKFMQIATRSGPQFHFFILFFTRAIFKLYIYIPTNCTQLIYFMNNTLKHMYCLKF